MRKIISNKILVSLLAFLLLTTGPLHQITLAEEHEDSQLVLSSDELAELERAERDIYEDNIIAQQIADNLPIQPDFKNYERAAKGSWSWRDGIICVSTNGKGVGWVNTWHAGIVAPQENYVVAEAPGPGQKVRLQSGIWQETGGHTVYQVGVNETSVPQDWNAGH